MTTQKCSKLSRHNACFEEWQEHTMCSFSLRFFIFRCLINTLRVQLYRERSYQSRFCNWGRCLTNLKFGKERRWEIATMRSVLCSFNLVRKENAWNSAASPLKTRSKQRLTSVTRHFDIAPFSLYHQYVKFRDAPDNGTRLVCRVCSQIFSSARYVTDMIIQKDLKQLLHFKMEICKTLVCSICMGKKMKF